MAQASHPIACQKKKKIATNTSKLAAPMSKKCF